ncbi:hypothetical protein BDN72DRAFT_837456 [Pluteus cervinus]|uniref:Uncharacterized protein n=1 Tax=Pluteus cervinus TaxID=181527 RepID=A0ACD3B115_9AGAR|nr:hypothetical protein BDN72DRAFT_837456 [Pluteus cervinus]
MPEFGGSGDETIMSMMFTLTVSVELLSGDETIMSMVFTATASFERDYDSGAGGHARWRHSL